jgi:hypothetical protein
MFKFLFLLFSISLFTEVSAAAHSPVKALIVSCVDYRLVIDDIPNFAKVFGLTEKTDLLTMPGASLGATLNDKSHTGHSHGIHNLEAAFDATFNFLKDAHNFEEVYVIDHRDCGMYKKIYGDKYASERDEETKQHVQNMRKFKEKMKTAFPGKIVRFFLMDIVPYGQPIKYEEIQFPDDNNIAVVARDWSDKTTQTIPLPAAK